MISKMMVLFCINVYFIVNFKIFLRLDCFNILYVVYIDVNGSC